MPSIDFRQVTITAVNGSVTLPFAKAMGYNLGKKKIGGGKLLRMEDGTGVYQTRWVKKVFTLSGNGKFPANMDDLDFTQSVTITALSQNPSAPVAGMAATFVPVSMQGFVRDFDDGFEWGLGSNSSQWSIQIEEM